MNNVRSAVLIRPGVTGAPQGPARGHPPNSRRKSCACGLFRRSNTQGPGPTSGSGEGIVMVKTDGARRVHRIGAAVLALVLAVLTACSTQAAGSTGGGGGSGGSGGGSGSTTASETGGSNTPGGTLPGG